ncbi:hypothetical protein DFJ74DRAFT_767846 [Hyaloraphidium curvatum]|nr:hypothetical protein DFJ74DRAFT_767846 [Hyaloraphidium curvatum]
MAAPFAAPGRTASDPPPRPHSAADRDPARASTAPHAGHMAGGAQEGEGFPGASPSHDGEPEISSRQLFVRNLPYSVSWQDLKDLMREAGGNVLRADVSVDADGKSKGFGSVVFEKLEDAKRAVEMFNGREYQGRILQVHQDRNARSEQTTMEGRQLFVTNLPYQMRWQDLKSMFREAGNVIRADVLLKSDGRSKGLGVVVFEKREEAEAAIQMFNNVQIHGRTIQVREDKLGHLAFLNNAPQHHHHHRSPGSSPGSPAHPADARMRTSPSRGPAPVGHFPPGMMLLPNQPYSFPMRYPGPVSPFLSALPPDPAPPPDPRAPSEPPDLSSLSLGDRPDPANYYYSPPPEPPKPALTAGGPPAPPGGGRRQVRPPPLMHPPDFPLGYGPPPGALLSPPPMSPLSFPVGPFHFNPLSPIYQQEGFGAYLPQGVGFDYASPRGEAPPGIVAEEQGGEGEQEPEGGEEGSAGSRPRLDACDKTATLIQFGDAPASGAPQKAQGPSMNTTRARLICMAADPNAFQHVCPSYVFVAVRGQGPEIIVRRFLRVDSGQAVLSNVHIPHAAICVNRRPVLGPVADDGGVDCNACGHHFRRVDAAVMHSFCFANHLECGFCNQPFSTIALLQRHAREHGCTAQDHGVAFHFDADDPAVSE